MITSLFVEEFLSNIGFSAAKKKSSPNYFRTKQCSGWQAGFQYCQSPTDQNRCHDSQHLLHKLDLFLLPSTITAVFKGEDVNVFGLHCC